MLIRFAVENYNSFKDQQVFSMVASKYTRHPSHFYNIKGKRLLKGSFFFGANASGKSNFVQALDFMRRIILGGTSAMRHNDRYFRIDPEYKEQPGVFQVDFVANQTVFSYGFAINYLVREICGEWLYRLDSSDKEICLFEREPDKPVYTELSLDRESDLRFKIYYEDLNSNELLLNEIGNKNLESNSAFADFITAYNWFKQIVIVYPNSHALNRHEFFLNSETNIDSMSELIQSFDTGIEAIKKGKQSAEKAFSFLPDEVRSKILNDIEQNLRKQNDSDKGRGMIEIGPYQFEISIEDGDIVAEKILLDHGNPSDLFEFSDESDGTKRLFDLLPLYDVGQRERIIVVDELDRSLHSKLTEKFIKLFFELTENKPSQLICTTHDLNLMDLQILRQDEIWFVERGKDHSSKIYSLSDYKQRFDKNILNDYLIGRYGAIPCFQDHEWQVESE